MFVSMLISVNGVEPLFSSCLVLEERGTGSELPVKGVELSVCLGCESQSGLKFHGAPALLTVPHLLRLWFSHHRKACLTLGMNYLPAKVWWMVSPTVVFLAVLIML